MPIYEYECTACGSRFERKQRIDEDPIKFCPACSGATRRVLHPVGIIFKGSGWYITDSRKGANGESGSIPPAEKKDGASGESKGEQKGEAKGGSKPESSGTTSAGKT